MDDLIKTLSATDLIQELEIKIEKAVNEAAAVSVYTLDSIEEAAHFIKNFSRLEKAIESTRKEYTEPLDSQKKIIMNFFKALAARFENEKARLEKETKDWLRRQKETEEAKAREERKKAEEAALAAAIEKENRMRAAGIENPIVEPAIIPETIIKPVNLNNINTSGIGTMKISKYEITNESLIPREYLTPNTALISAHRKAAGFDAVSTIPGVRFYYEETITRR